MTPHASIHVFRHRDFPGDTPGSLVYGAAIMQPVIAVSIPWMIIGLVLSLMWYDPLPVLVWGVPISYLLAVAWGVLMLHRKIVEILVADGHAALRSLWDIASRDRHIEWEPIIGLKRVRNGFLLLIGSMVLEIEEDEWPEFDELKESLRASLHEA